MSPYCPQCLGSAGEQELRCPLDQQFFQRRNCAHCDEEMFPREIYCAHCGSLGRDVSETLLLPPGAGGRRIVSSLLLDVFATSILLLALFINWSPLLGIVMFLPTSMIYRALGRSGGRQTFAQVVFHTLSISPTAGPVSFLPALRCTFWEVVYFFTLLTQGDLAQAKLEQRTKVLEVLAS